MAITPVAAYAEENTGVEEQTTQQSSVSEEEPEEDGKLIGTVKEVGEDSITVEIYEDILDDGTEDSAEGTEADAIDDTGSNGGAEDTADGSGETGTAEDDAEPAGDDDASGNDGISDGGMAQGEERTITVTEDTKIYHVSDTEEGRLMMQEYPEGQDAAGLSDTVEDASVSTDGLSYTVEDASGSTDELSDTGEDVSEGMDELSDLEEIGLTSILAGDAVSIILDEEGNASVVLVMYGAGELSSDSEESDILIEDTDELTEDSEAAEG